MFIVKPSMSLTAGCLQIQRIFTVNITYLPRVCQASASRPPQKRVKALADCRAVSSEQLAFFKDEIIVVTASSDPHWWVSATTVS